MGFKAINQDGEAVFSFDLNNSQWQDLKANHNKRLRMNCCDAVAIPKNSAKGTPFFAHYTQGNCNHKPESVSHMFCKYLLITSLKSQGWEAETEKQGCTPSGERWIADVYATKNNSKIIFEVQWSGITLEEITRRNEKYKKSGIKCVWLKRSNINCDLLFESNRELIIFGLSDDFNVFGIKKYKEKPYTENAKLMNIDCFINDLLSGRIQYGIKNGEPVKVSPYVTPLYNCDCGSNISVLRSFLVQNLSGYWLAKGANEFNTRVNYEQLNNLMMQENITRIIKRTSKYHADVKCNSCGKIINRQISWGNTINKMLFIDAVIVRANKLKSNWFIKNQDLH